MGWFDPEPPPPKPPGFGPMFPVPGPPTMTSSASPGVTAIASFLAKPPLPDWIPPSACPMQPPLAPQSLTEIVVTPSGTTNGTTAPVYVKTSTRPSSEESEAPASGSSASPADPSTCASAPTSPSSGMSSRFANSVQPPAASDAPRRRIRSLDTLLTVTPSSPPRSRCLFASSRRRRALPDRGQARSSQAAHSDGPRDRIRVQDRSPPRPSLRGRTDRRRPSRRRRPRRCSLRPPRAATGNATLRHARAPPPVIDRSRAREEAREAGPVESTAPRHPASSARHPSRSRRSRCAPTNRRWTQPCPVNRGHLVHLQRSQARSSGPVRARPARGGKRARAPEPPRAPGAAAMRGRPADRGRRDSAEVATMRDARPPAARARRSGGARRPRRAR